MFLLDKLTFIKLSTLITKQTKFNDRSWEILMDVAFAYKMGILLKIHYIWNVLK